MSYHLVGQDFGYPGLGCGPECGCTGCRSRLHGYDETYVPEAEDGAEELSEAPPAPTEAQLRRAYQQSCRGVRVLQTLSRQARSPSEKVRFFERKLAAVPRLVEGYQQIRRLIRAAQQGAPRAALHAALRRVLQAYPELVEFPFPPGYAVGSVEHERAMVRCQLAQARWELKVFQRTGRVPGRLLRPSGP